MNRKKKSQHSSRPRSADTNDSRRSRSGSFAPRFSGASPQRRQADVPNEPIPFELVVEKRMGIRELEAAAKASREKVVELVQMPVSLPPKKEVRSESVKQETVVAENDAGKKVDRGFRKKEVKSVAVKTKAEVAEIPSSSVYGAMFRKEGFVLDPWQEKAISALLDGHDLVVDAPTSAGKTRVVETLLDLKIKDGLRMIYTSPVKSLSNDKYREFSEKYGAEFVGINTGDFKENLGAPIILATLETYRNSLLGVEPRFDRSLIVYDEYHFLQDEGRGSAWEESIILTPRSSQVVMLSASVPNAEDFSAWLKQLREKECEVIKVAERPVPLVDLIYTVKYGWILADELRLRSQEILELRQMTRRNRPQGNRMKRIQEEMMALVKPVKDVLALGLGPLVIYAGRRADTERIAQTMARHLKVEMKPEEATRLKDCIASLSGWEYVPSELQQLILRHGIAYHHSGLIPPGRVAIESLLKGGYLRICTGTMGISLGVNFAVRSAIIADEMRPGEGGETRYSATEIMQMLGRAGRRGKDRQGFSLWLSLGRYADQKPTGREPCRSSLKFDPTTVLGILGQHENLAYLSEFYMKSFFMRGRSADEVLVSDHDMLSAMLYKNPAAGEIACDNIPETYAGFKRVEKKRESRTGKQLCAKCPAQTVCHPLMERVGKSTLDKIVFHLQEIGAIDGAIPTIFGQLARHFPQAGGMLIAKWLATGQMNSSNFIDYCQAMASFCAAHFKDIPDTHANIGFLRSLRMPELVDAFYPESLFAELYDEVRFSERDGQENRKIFRECNYAAASIVAQWLREETGWEDLVADHEAKNFSAGDCMMVLFRFSTFLQSCIRVAEFNPEIAAEAQKLRKIILREPLDARNRMLLEAVGEDAAANEPDVMEESPSEI